MNAAYELAKLFKERENNRPYAPREGIVESLPDIKIRINDKVVLSRDMIKSVVNLLARNNDGDYIWLGRRVYLLPWADNSGRIDSFLIIGGDGLGD